MTANSIIAGMIGYEFLQGDNLQHKFGGGFEAVYYDGERFRFVENYVVCFWEAIRDKDGISFRMPGIIYRVSYLDELLYIKKYEDIGYDDDKKVMKIGAPKHFFIGPMIGDVSPRTIQKIRKDPDGLTIKTPPDIYNHVIACKASVVMPGAADDRIFSTTTAERLVDNPKFKIVEHRGSIQLIIQDGCFKDFERILLEQSKSANKTFNSLSV